MPRRALFVLPTALRPTSKSGPSTLLRSGFRSETKDKAPHRPHPEPVIAVRPLLLAALQSAVLMPVLGIALVTSAAPAPAAVTVPLPTTSPAIVVTKPQPVLTKPAPVKAAPRPAARPVRKSQPKKAVVRRTTTTTTVRALTGKALMLAAVARIPGYPTDGATWVMTSKYGSWGVADWKNGIVYISPSVPANRMFDVVAHEWSHVLSVRAYDSTTEAKAAMNRVFGGSGLTGAERAADCMARQLGASWTHYTDCTNATWRAAAAKLVAGERV